MEACRSRPADVGRLLAEGASPDARTRTGWTALAQAIEGLDVDSAPVLALLAAGASVEGHTTPVLIAACARSKILEVLPALLSAGADLEAAVHTHTAVSVAALKQPHAVPVLLAAGANPEPLGRVLEKGGVACHPELRALWSHWTAHRRLQILPAGASETNQRRL